MDPSSPQRNNHLGTPSSSRASSISSAIDLTGTPAGIANSASVPSSPTATLTPGESTGSVSRRRLSWVRSNMDRQNVTIDPLGLNAFGETTVDASSSLQQPQSDGGRTPPSRARFLMDDPFSDGAGPSSVRIEDYDAYTPQYERSNPYSLPDGVQASRASLIPSVRSKETTESIYSEIIDDDDARLTSFASQPGGSDRSGNYNSNSLGVDDIEHRAERTPDSKRSPGNAKRKSIRYSTTPSPASRLRSVSRNLRRVSLRVVNLAGVGVEDQGRRIRLPDDKQDEEEELGMDEEDVEADVADLEKRMPLRGRTLGFLGRTNRFRLAMYHFLTYPWTEPTILLLIIFNAIVLTIQSARTVTLPENDDGSTPLPSAVRGYFHSWEDYALFFLFISFTLEATARIVTTGFILDPEIPTSMLFRSPFTPPDPRSPVVPLPRDPQGITLHHSNSTSSGLNRSTSQRKTQGVLAQLSAHLSNFSSNILQPFALAHHSHAPTNTRTATSLSVPTLSSASTMDIQSEKLKQALPHLRTQSKPTLFSNALKSDGALSTATGDSKDGKEYLGLPFKLSVRTAHGQVARNVPYLRHSWNRIDFIAIVAFWISFTLAMAGAERSSSHHIAIFRALSVLRTSRLLAVTSGTTTIMSSLKRARPLLTNVAYFVVFAMVLFSIIGVQSFQGSFRRSCWIQPVLGEPAQVNPNQRCGGHINATTLNITGYVLSDGSISSTSKGYICPLGQICREDKNPDSDIESFDTIYYSALQVVIVASANGWSPVMYNMIDSEFFVSCFFFIICILVLNFWLINLFVAVITNTFSAIRSETKKSAFGAAPMGPILNEKEEDDWDPPTGSQVSGPSLVRRWYDRSKWVWVLFALCSVVLQATRSADSSPEHLQLLTYGELALTFLFDIDIVWRFTGYLPRWRSFFDHGNNWLDLMLAVGCSIIQIPEIRNSAVYPWLTIFQLARFYRVILEVPRMRPLLLSVFGNLYGLVNMSLFLLLANYVAALVAVQLLRGDLGDGVTMNFGQIYTSFLAMYQIFSSENWTNVLYSAAQAEVPLGQSALTVLFICAWFLFANFIMLQLFIAVINENFDIAEEHKKKKQASYYWAMQQPIKASPLWLKRLNPYRWFKANPKAIAVESLPANLVLPMQKSMVEDYPVQKSEGYVNSPGLRGHYSSKSITLLNRLFTGEGRTNDVPLATLRAARRDSVVPQDPNDEELERHLEILAAFNNESARQEDINDILFERKAQKADFIRAHPSYDKTFWIFSQKSTIRQLCQRIVQPANGERIFGLPHSLLAHSMFQLLLLLAVIGGIVVEAIATPVYRRNFYGEHGYIRGAWFDIAEAALGITFFIEFVIKLIADGLIFTPNAYLRSIWNFLDFLILIGLLINFTTGLIFIGGLSRLTRSLKALRALRLITLIDKMRSTFQSLIFSGAIRILDAALLAILYMIPYAVWGLNIFAGLLNECNDGNASGLVDCNNEFVNTVYGNSFGFPVPRVWSNPAPSTTFSFDSFRSSLLILFEIVSLEGWIDVMGVATSATGRNLQPQTNASQANAIFFLIYNLFGAVVLLTLFVSIIIGNFSSRAGLALLTQAQRQWIDLQKLIKRQRPSQRPKRRPVWPIRAWCFDRATHKHGWWSRMMTFFFVVHVFALMTQTLSNQDIANTLRSDFFTIITLIYVVDIIVRWFGLGFRSFRANGWNIFDVIVAVGALITTIVIRLGSTSFLIEQLQKLFLVSIAFKLVQRTNSLNQLFKTAIASLPSITSLLALWFILFLFFSILFVEVFSLTKWNTAETRDQNYSSLGSALVMLAFMSTGEGWNQYMHDFALMVYPRCTLASAIDPDSDCGSAAWAFSLFIAWNLLSMYIFVNMFTGVVVESFSYVFQLVDGAKSITREEMRAFKKVWAEFANPRTGYLEKHQLVPFFAKLSGIFEVKIYPTEFSIPNLMAGSQNLDPSKSKNEHGIDLQKLCRLLSEMDYKTTRKRATIYSRLYHEALISQEPGKGISFTNMLLMLAHHKLIDDREALTLQELVTRSEINRFVNDLVNLDRVRSLLKTIYYRRQFLLHRQQSKQLSQSHRPSIPAIIVEDHPVSPIGRDITQANRNSVALSADRSPITPINSPEASWLSDGSPLRGHGLRRNRRTSDISMLSADLSQQYAETSRDSLNVEEDAERVLSSLQNSIWGEMMLNAAEE